MDPELTQRKPVQAAETSRKSSGRKRRLSEVMPELRARIQPLFHRGVSVERIGEDLDVSPVQLLEHVVREYVGAKHPGPFVVRKPVGSETVREFKMFRQGGAA
jgi:hypothetical protein